MMKIGKISLEKGFILAPLSGVTNMIFRLLMKRLGAELVYTEMVSANGIVYGQPNTMAYLMVAEEERPVVVQLFGSDPVVMARAAAIAEGKGADILDINMGCPVKKVTRQGAGAALLKDPKKAIEIAKRVVKAVSIPVTVKTRIGSTKESLIAADFLNALGDVGIGAVVVHGRTATCSYSESANWEFLESLREKTRIPLIPNGDIFLPQQVVHLLRERGWPAVMLGRATLRAPFIFLESSCLMNGEPMISEKRKLLLDTIGWALDTTVSYMGEEKALKLAKKVLLRCIKGVEGARLLRHELAQREGIRDMSELMRFVKGVVGCED